MPNQIDIIVNTFIKEIMNLMGEHFKKAILFGSYARGDFEDNSDIDIMILTDLNDEDLNKCRMCIREIACELEMQYDVIISPIVRNLEKYNKRIDIIPFYMNVQKEGVILHG